MNPIRSFSLLAMIAFLCSTAVYAEDHSVARNSSEAAAPAKDWPAILGPAQAALPNLHTNLEAVSKVVWSSDLTAALATAKAENRPVFVTLRCLPCKQCSAFDKDVLEGGADLDPLLKQFITVRIVDAKAADMRILPMATMQDLDLSWWGYFLSPEGRVYGVFGGRDEVSDATRISKSALVATLRRVLAHHNDSRRLAWDIDGPVPDVTGAAKSPADLPGYGDWSKHTKLDPRTAQAGCIHCHQVSEILREPAIQAGSFDKNRDLQLWPLPENVGVKVDRDDGLRVVEIIPGSPADKAGLRAGDVIAAAGSGGSMRKLFGQADFRGILQRAPIAATLLDVYYLRDGKPIAAQLNLPEGWHKTVLDWRMSIAHGAFGGELGFFPVKATDQDRKNLGVAPDALLVKAWAPYGPAKAAGLQHQSWVIAIDGQKADLSGRPFMIWFRLNHQPNDPVTLTVVSKPGSEPTTITYKAGVPGKF